MKYMSTQLDHDWIIVLDPFAVPLRPLDELFHIYNNSRFQGGALESTLIALSKLPKRDKEICKNSMFRNNIYSNYVNLASFLPFVYCIHSRGNYVSNVCANTRVGNKA